MKSGAILKAQAEKRFGGAESAPLGMARGSRFSVPWDLTEWADKETLRVWLAEEIEQLDWGDPLVGEYLKSRPRDHPKTMLAVLGYAYCTGMFESEEITHACEREPSFRALSQGRELSASRMKRFRRENRLLLHWVIIRLTQRALAQKQEWNAARLPAGLRRLLEESAWERLQLARHLDRGPNSD